VEVEASRLADADAAITDPDADVVDTEPLPEPVGLRVAD
jgi:hypothetical protein